MAVPCRHAICSSIGGSAEREHRYKALPGEGVVDALKLWQQMHMEGRVIALAVFR